MPDSPKQKALQRQLAWRIQNDWLKLGRILLTHKDSINPQQAKIAHQKLSDALVTLSPVFGQSSYFMSDEFGWCDVLLGAMLYRLDEMQIELPTHLCRPLIEYQKRLFERESFLQTIE